MKNSKIRRMIATAMASIMVIGSSMNAFAADAVSGNTAGVSGNGTSTGHVDRSVVNVAWPVEKVNDTTFDYIMDAEGLVAETASINAIQVTLPPSNDTGVYFATETTGTYANYSQAKEVINKSSVSLNISATAVPSVSEGTMVALAGSKSEVEEEGDTPLLLLELSVGDAKGSISSNAGVTVTKTVSGCSANYAVKNTEGTTYVYQMIDSPDASLWATASISLNGATRKVKNVGSVKAPKISVTWSYEKTDKDSSSTTEEEEEPTVTYPWSATDGVTITGTESPYTFAVTKSTGKVTFNNSITKVEYRTSSSGSWSEYQASSTNVTKSGTVLSILKSYIDGKSAGFQLRVTTSDGQFIFTK